MFKSSISFVGEEEVSKFLSKDKSFSSPIEHALTNLHTSLKKTVFSRYTANNNLDTQLIKTTLSASEGVLVYKVTANDLSKFPTTWEWGNINPGAARLGRVHSVKVLKEGGWKVVYGKGHRGGFQPRGASGAATKIFRGGSQMFERTTDKRFPLRVLYGPNTANMIFWALNHTDIANKTLGSLSFEITESYK